MNSSAAARPLVIAHRGASGYIPEHTLAAYALAIEMAADYIEPDLVMTGDGVLVARHENEISATTDIAERAEFASRRTCKTIDGLPVEGWFTEDFTLAELKTLRAKERIPHLRPGNRRFDGLFPVPTLEEVLWLVRATNLRFQLAAEKGGENARRVGVYPEIKHPTYFRSIGLQLEQPLARLLHAHGFSGRDGMAFIQCFEVASLRHLRTLTELPLIQLLGASGRPYDFETGGDRRTYADMAEHHGLVEIATYADGIGVDKTLLISGGADGSSVSSAMIADAHAADMIVHAWTFRAENTFLAPEFRNGSSDAVVGNLEREIIAFLAHGINGFFIDHPDIGVRARDMYLARQAGLSALAPYLRGADRNQSS
jgi:glycerophosphoryl diester phosphodiesterase